MTSGYFDRVWRTGGRRGLKNAFDGLKLRSRAELVSAVADEGNSFPVMYLLAPNIESNELERDTPAHVLHAYWVVASAARDDERLDRLENLLGKDTNSPDLPSSESLKWMIDTGANWDGPSSGRDGFDASIDLAAAHLAAKHPDGESLSKIAELIFRRNRQGLLVHDLVWGFFQAADAEALSVVAKYILSENLKDSGLACKLLGLDAPKTQREKSAAHRQFTSWLAENRPYIYLTGESFNAASVPCHLGVDFEAKHVHHEIHPRTREPLTPYSQEELRAIEVFRAGNGGELV